MTSSKTRTTTIEQAITRTRTAREEQEFRDRTQTDEEVIAARVGLRNLLATINALIKQQKL